MADREIRYLFRKKETSGSTLPPDSVIGEPFVNTFEGRMFFSGTPGGTYVPICGQTSVFEVGANVDYSNIASGLTTPYVDFRTGLTNPSLMAGRTFYDQNENALSYYPKTDNMDVTLNIGQETLIRVYNNSGNIIYNGQACHINGAELSGGVSTIILANAGDNRFDVSGIATHDIPNGEYGFITNFGIVRDLIITGTSIGSEIYLSDKNDGEFIYSLNDIEITSRTTKIGRVISTGSTSSKILVDIDNEYGFLLTDKTTNSIAANLTSTGAGEFEGLSANTYDNSKFDVGSIKGWIIDNTTDILNPIVRYIYYSGSSESNPSGITLNYLATHPVTYVGISGDTTADIVQSTIPFTNSQWRDIIKLGVIVHSNNTSVITTNIQPVINTNPIPQIYDLMGGLGKFNVSGNVFKENGANLKVEKTEGKIFSPGCNYLIDRKNPHIKTLASGSPVTFRYRLQNSVEYSNTTDVDPNYYDLNGVLTSVPINKFTIQRAALFESNLSRWQYGQNLYDSIDDAEASIPIEDFIEEPNIKENGLVRAFIIVKQGTTDLTNKKFAKIVECSKWGSSVETIPGNVHRIEILNSSSTGLREGGKMITASTTTFSIEAGSGIIINNSDANNPVFQEVIWQTQTGISISNITGEVATYIAINNSGTTVQYPFSSPPTQSDKRSNIFLGFVAHSTKTSITNVYNYPIHFVSPVNQHEDLTTSIGPFSINGNQVSAITGTFELQKTAGHSYMYGSDFQSDATNPSILTCPQASGSSTPQYRLVYAKGSEIIGLSGYTVDHLNYNPGGGSTITPVSNHYFVTHRVWHLPITNLLVWQYGQYQYSTLGDAINNLNTENYVSPPSLATIGYLLAVFIVGEDATSLTQVSQNRVIYQNKFAGTGGGGGAIADTLQTAYNNSSQPEILTDSTRGAVTFQNGAGADSLNLIEGKNSGGVITSFIRGDGYISGSTLNGGILLSAGTNLYDIMSSFATPPGGTSGNIQYNANGVFSGSPYYNFIDRGGVLFSGGDASLSAISGAGTKLMWIPAKGTLAAGTVTSTQWDYDNIGSYNAIFGYDSKGDGDYNIVTGNINNVVGSGNAVFGQNNTVGSWVGTAGYNVVGGINNVISQGVVLSEAFGMGHYMTASHSFATGVSNQMIGSPSFSLGFYNDLNAEHSFAFGQRLVVNSYNSTAIGRYSMPSGITNAWISTDPLFQIGNGGGYNELANDAFRINKNASGWIRSGSTTNGIYWDGIGNLTAVTMSATSISADTIYTHSISGMSPVNINGVVVENTSISANTIALAAGTTSKAPIQLTSGDLLSFELPGAIEFKTDDLYLGISTGEDTVYISQYPPVHNDTYVKATSVSDGHYAYYVTDPSKPLTGNTLGNSWYGYFIEQRLHIDLGTAKIINRIYYENGHYSGEYVGESCRNFTLWGSNNASAFAELTYGIDTDWTQIAGLSQNYFDQHIAADQADPKYITFTNTTPYRYYALKIADNWGGGNTIMYMRHIELQYGAVSYPRCPIVLADEDKLTATKIPLASTNGRLTDSLISQTTGGTVNISGNTNILSLSATSISADTIYSGSTDLYNIFQSFLTSPGGSNTQIQYNNNGGFSGDTGFTYVNGNVGVGTIAPTRQLEIRNSIVTYPSITFYTDLYGGHIDIETNGGVYGALYLAPVSGEVRIYRPGKNSYYTVYDSSGIKKIHIGTNSASYFNGGNVGIGTRTPSERLTVSGNTYISEGLIASTISATTVSASTVTTDEIISVNGIYITDSDRNKAKVGTWKFYIDGGDLKVAKLTGGTDWVVASTFTV